MILNTTNLHSSREADQAKSKPQAGPLSRCNTNTGTNSVQDSEHDSGQDGEGGDLIQGQGALGDEDSSSGNNKTFNQIFDNAVHNFSKSVTHHLCIFHH